MFVPPDCLEKYTIKRENLAVYGGRLLLVVAVLLTITTGVSAAAGQPVDVDLPDLNGSGTADDPYEISNASELQAVGDDTASLGANYRLVSDINATATRSWNSRKGFDPIGACQDGGSGCTADPFTGSFNGSGYTISNLTINRTVKEVGLFGATNGSTVQDVRLTNVSITGNTTSVAEHWQYVGSLVGVNDGTVDSVFVSGQVDGIAINSTDSRVYAGGIVGDNNGTITQSVVAVNVTVKAGFLAYAGGVTPQNDGRIEASVATGNVTAASGINFPNGESTYAGGLVGSNKNRIENAYASGDVDGDADVDVYVGGLVGYNGQDLVTGTSGRVTATYATGTLTATAGNVNKGGLVGINPTGTVDDSYFDNTPDNGIGTQLSTADIQGSSSPTTMTGLWGSTVWETVEAGDSGATADGYPVLSAVERQRQLEQQGLNARTSVRTWNDLDAVRNDLDGSYHLTDDLGANVTGYDDVAATTANGGNGFDPIGPFDGTFDGRNRTIGNLMVDRATDKVGLFGSTGSSATVEYLHLDAVSVVGNDDTGGLVGNSSGSIRYSTVDGTVNGSDNVGGIVGYSEGTVNASNATATINGSTDVGGLVGDLYQGSITASTASGDVDGTGVNPQGDTNAGGLVGYLYSSDLRTSNASGTVNGTSENVGGLAGQSFDSMIADSNASGDVNGTDNTGGLVGNANDGKRIENSSATGAVDGSGNVGGLVGYNLNNDITRSHATGHVDGASKIGGLVGWNTGGNRQAITESYATGTANGTNSIGGLVGWNDGSKLHVQRSFATGTVTATTGGAGGLIGTNRGPVANTSANGTVIGDVAAGGLVGRNTGTVSNSVATGTVDYTAASAGGLVAFNNSGVGTAVDAYWDVNATNQSTSQGGTGVTTANLTGQEVSTLAGLNDTSVWTRTDSYPVLRWRVDDLGLSLADTDLNVGDSTAATVSLSLAGDGSPTATATSDYSSNDTGVATVDAGTVTAQGGGGAAITAEVAGRADTAALSVSTFPDGGGDDGGGGGGQGGGGGGGTRVPESPYPDARIDVGSVSAGEPVLISREYGGPLTRMDVARIDRLWITTSTAASFSVRVAGYDRSVGRFSSLSSQVGDTAAVGYAAVEPSLGDDDITEGRIRFGIDGGVALDNGSVTLYRYDDRKWQPLNTTRVDTEGTTAYYDAVTPGFSMFAIGVETDQAAVQRNTGDGATVASTETGDPTEPSGVLIAGIAVGLVLVVGGLVALRRRTQQPEEADALD